MHKDLKFHHLALAVRDDTHALAFLSALGYETGVKIYDKEQNVHVRLCTAEGQPAVEIVMPGDGKNPLDSFLAKSPEIIYHTCYETHDVAAFLSGLKTAGVPVAVISAPKPAILFDGRKVSFYYIKGYGIIELLDAAS